MRDINRIDPLLKKLAEAWEKHPDLRFGQFLSRFLSSYGGDVWNLEEDEWMVAIQAYIDGKNMHEMVDAYQEEKWKQE
ncbi:MAG: hypothetical protein IJ292_04550 [Clostridia bacterium]|nr:hypothetical protein [Clostridia bacterium]